MGRPCPPPSSTPTSSTRSSTRRARCSIVAGAGLGQDPGAHPSHRPPDRATRASAPFEILAITFTNKAADEMKQRVGGAGRPGGPEDVGVDVPLGVRAHPAARRRPRSATRRRSRSTTRPTPCGSPATCIRDLNLDPKRFPPAVGARHDQRGEERRCRRRRSTPSGRQVDLRAQDRRRLPRVPGPPAARPAPWTSTTCSTQHRAAVPRAPRRARALPASASSTSWSTSTRTPTRRRTRSSLHAGAASTATSASSATATSASTGSAAPTSATSSSSRRRSPTPR